MTFWEFINKQIIRVEFKHIIALAIVVFTFKIFDAVLFSPLSLSSDKYASQIITGLNSILGMVLGFWFVASSSSAKKDNTIASMAANNAAQTTIALKWLGAFDSPPQTPSVNDAYVDSATNKNYYWNGTDWVVTAQTPKA